MGIALVVLRMDILTNESVGDAYPLYVAADGSSDIIHHSHDERAPYQDSVFSNKPAECKKTMKESVYAHLLRYFSCIQ